MIFVYWIYTLQSLQSMVTVSQCQAIHARSIFPCQDTPDIKSTYEFNLQSPLPTLASGLPVHGNAGSTSEPDATSPGTKSYKFKQMIPIPSYLFAIASGYSL